MTPSKPPPRARRKVPAEDERQVLVRAILKLPTRLRDVFLLHRMAGMSYSEIGLHLGMTPKAVETSLAAALVRLMRAVPTSDPSSENQTPK
ncbi:MAG: sigma-70 family RNA polymerase sigma factor [Brevundimonas sp.]|nr:MAG: sigma-70 family RNA polymerase sigma factor [Brevundimonas sp.]